MNQRAYWVDVLERIAEPVLTSLSQHEFKKRFIIDKPQREKYGHLEAFGRLVAGIAPWLDLPVDNSREGQLRSKYRELVSISLDAATNPISRDCLNFSEGNQPLVDAAFLAQGILRAPHVLWEPLSSQTKQNVINSLKETRIIRPPFKNWLLFSAMVEAALHLMEGSFDAMRVDYAIRQHEQWYIGDGLYCDGPGFRYDYYNSFVIQPMLLDIVNYFASIRRDWQGFLEPVTARARRYAAILESLISPEGTFPPIGRSLAYRFGAFHLLGQMALKEDLPPEISPAQVCCALTAAISKSVEAPGTFDEEGWLTVGFCGCQPEIGEKYICNGSTYLCTTGLLPLGLAAETDFWMLPSAPWTAKKMWGMADLNPDKSLRRDI